MFCPKCGAKTTVSNGVINHDANEYYRERRCLVCNKRYYTVEFEVERDEQFIHNWRKYYRKHLNKGKENNNA